jgi:dolichyl-phosphate beta-glucosyltransferase
VPDAPDRTLEIVASKKELFRQYLVLKPGTVVGKGRDVQYGMVRAQGKIVMFMDADLATPLRYLKTFYSECMEGSDVVIGIRDQVVRHPAFIRRSVSSFGGSVFALLSGVKVIDTQCGFKMFSERAAQLCFSKLTVLGWWFDMEALTIAQSNDLKIKAITVDGWQAMPFSTYMVSNWQIISSYMADMFHIVRNRLNGTYKI